MIKSILIVLFLVILPFQNSAQERQRARELGIKPGILTPGKYNAITDVAGVSVGQKTLVIGDSIRTAPSRQFI